MGIITNDSVSSNDPRPTPKDMDTLASQAVQVLMDAMTGREPADPSLKVTANQIAAAAGTLHAWATYDGIRETERGRTDREHRRREEAKTPRQRRKEEAERERWLAGAVRDIKPLN